MFKPKFQLYWKKRFRYMNSVIKRVLLTLNKYWNIHIYFLYFSLIIKTTLIQLLEI